MTLLSPKSLCFLAIAALFCLPTSGEESKTPANEATSAHAGVPTKGADTNAKHSIIPNVDAKPRRQTLSDLIELAERQVVEHELPAYEKFMDAYLDTSPEGVSDAFSVKQAANNALLAEKAELKAKGKTENEIRTYFASKAWAEKRLALKNGYESEIAKILKSVDDKSLEQMIKSAKENNDWTTLSAIELILRKNDKTQRSGIANWAAGEAKLIDSNTPAIKTQIVHLQDTVNVLKLELQNRFSKAYEAATGIKSEEAPTDKALAKVIASSKPKNALIPEESEQDPQLFELRQKNQEEHAAANQKLLKAAKFPDLVKVAEHTGKKNDPLDADAFESQLMNSEISVTQAENLRNKGKELEATATEKSPAHTKVMTLLEKYISQAGAKSKK